MQFGSRPGLYHRTVRVLAIKRGIGPAENAGRFARVNAAMGDAGIFAWKEKYRHNLWRPVLGIREYDHATGPGAGGGSKPDERGDPFWLLFGSGCCGTSTSTCRLQSPSASSLSPGWPPRPSSSC